MVQAGSGSASDDWPNATGETIHEAMSRSVRKRFTKLMVMEVRGVERGNAQSSYGRITCAYRLIIVALAHDATRFDEVAAHLPRVLYEGSADLDPIPGR